MKKIKRWRYYCDYCNKSGGSKWHMEQHEKRCTNNPDRECGLCEMAGEHPKTGNELKEYINQFVTTESYESLGEVYTENVFKGCESKSMIVTTRISELRKEKEKSVLKLLREFTGGCPACMLTAMRLSKTTSLFQSFNAKQERDIYYKEMLDDLNGYYC